MNIRLIVVKFIFLGGILLFFILVLFGIVVGVVDINLSMVWDVFFYYNSLDM